MSSSPALKDKVAIVTESGRGTGQVFWVDGGFTAT
jgi:hypothetical protein